MECSWKNKHDSKITSVYSLFQLTMTVDYASRLLFKVLPIDKSKTKCLSHALLLSNNMVSQTGKGYSLVSQCWIWFRKGNVCISAVGSASFGQSHTFNRDWIECDRGPKVFSSFDWGLTMSGTRVGDGNCTARICFVSKTDWTIRHVCSPRVKRWFPTLLVNLVFSRVLVCLWCFIRLLF